MAKTLYALAITIAVLGTSVAVLGQTTTTRGSLNSIPEHLLECYKNSTLYSRENRLPMTMNVLIELIEIIENYPGFTMDIRGLSLSLIHMFRVDGIEKDPNIQPTDQVTPFRLSGHQFHKYKILLSKLIAQSPYQFQNASLTSIQKCSLHFMLSNSIDDTLRGDEGTTCSSNNRVRRDVGDENDQSYENDDLEVSNPLNEEEDPEETVPSQEDNKSQPDSPGSEHEDQSKPGVEIIGEIITNSSKGNLMNWDRDGDNGDNHAARQVLPEPVKSNCPVENGVVYTNWGSVSAGTVLAGIATGLSGQNVTIKNIRNDGKDFNGGSVDSKWAATLAGDLAEVALLQGPYYTATNLVVGSSGNWNNTSIPRWYFINGANPSEMTDAEIRGGIDGLAMATYVTEWNNKVNGRLRLSNLLKRYYSIKGVFDTKYRACNRRTLFLDLTPTATMNQEVLNFAITMHELTASLVHIDDVTIKSYTDAANQKLVSYVPSNLPGTDCAAPRDSFPHTRGHMDLYVIVNCNLPYKDVIERLGIIGGNISLGESGSRMTVISAKDFQYLLNSTTKQTHIHENLTADVYNRGQAGFDTKKLYEVNLKELFSKNLDLERTDPSYVSTQSKIVLFITDTFSPSEDEFNSAKTAVKDFRNTLPDVKFIYLVSSSNEKLQELAEDRDKDIFLFTNVDNVAPRLNDVHRRIINPICGSNWTEKSYQTAEVEDYLEHLGINYYRVHPKYLFGMSSGSVKIQSATSGDLKVCHSRQFENPNTQNNSTTDGANIQCKQITSDVYEIPLSEPCGGHEYVLQCPPLYVSVESTGTTPNNCVENVCPDISDLKVTITHTGMTCGVGQFLANPLILTLSTVLLTSLKMIFSS